MRGHLLRLALACATAGGAAGCGPDVDEGSADGGPDAGGADAAPTGNVAVTVYQRGILMGGADLIAHDADGHVVGASFTGADGHGSLTVPAGGMVTAAILGQTLYSLETVTGVQPGEDLTIGLPHGFGSDWPPAIATARIRLPGAVAGAVVYWIDLGVDCGGVVEDPTRLAHVNVAAECLHDGGTTFPVLVRANDAKNRMVAYTFVEGVSITSPAVTMPAWRTPGSLAVAGSNLPADASTFEFFSFPMFDGAHFAGFSHELKVNGRTSLTAHDQIATGFGDHLGIFAGVTVGDTFVRMLGVETSPPPAALTLDVDALPPLLSGVSRDPDPSGRAAVTWTTARPSDDVDLLTIDVATDLVEWTLFGPATATRVVLPELPDFLALAQPGPDAPFSCDVYLIDSDAVDGYDAARALGVDLSRQLDFDRIAPGSRASIAVASCPQ